MLIEGSLGVNGNIYSLNPTANATVNVANNGMTITGADNTVVLQADDDSSDENARASLTMAPDSASLLVNTDSGNSHGIIIGQDSTVISGGTSSTTLTLSDDGARFANSATGGPVRVTGVANGVDDFDAVNMRQFRRLESRVDKAYSGIASVAAMAAVPAPLEGRNFCVGLGTSYFEGESAIAFGAKALVGDNRDITITSGVGYSGDVVTVSAGVGWSF
jgi:autotransporter adhesin